MEITIRAESNVCGLQAGQVVTVEETALVRRHINSGLLTVTATPETAEVIKETPEGTVPQDPVLEVSPGQTVPQDTVPAGGSHDKRRSVES